MTQIPVKCRKSLRIVEQIPVKCRKSLRKVLQPMTQIPVKCRKFLQCDFGLYFISNNLLEFLEEILEDWDLI